MAPFLLETMALVAGRALPRGRPLVPAGHATTGSPATQSATPYFTISPRRNPLRPPAHWRLVRARHRPGRFAGTRFGRSKFVRRIDFAGGHSSYRRPRLGRGP